MKRLLYISTCCVAMTFSACNKYLGTTPDSRSQLDTPEKISELLVSAYPQAGYATFCEAMSDNVADIGIGDAYNPNQDAYFWRDVRSDAQDSPEYYWNECYKAIAAANQALYAISQKTDPQNYQAQKGEALVARAYAHFMLVCIFSKMYDESSANTDMGIPYVTEPETVVIKKYDRKTVQYVYDMVAKDIEEGMPLIKDKSYLVPRYHFNRQAAEAFAARFYLYAKQYDKSIAHASKVLPSESWGDNMRPWLTTLASAANPTEMATIMNSASTSANLLLAQTISWWARYYKSYRYATSASIADGMKTANNITNSILAIRWNSWDAGLYWASPKYLEFFVYNSAGSDAGKAYVMVPLLTIEEALLTRAEARILSGDYTAAMTDLNIWVKARVSGYTPAANNITEVRVKSFYGVADLREGLIKTILDIKRVEFMHEGTRWFDILRYQLPVTHTIAGGGAPVTLPLNDPRRVVQLPQLAATIGGLPLNPR